LRSDFVYINSSYQNK